MGSKYTKTQARRALKEASFKIAKVAVSGYMTLGAAGKICDAIAGHLRRIK
jgi:hypothetical protein